MWASPQKSWNIDAGVSIAFNRTEIPLSITPWNPMLFLSFGLLLLQSDWIEIPSINNICRQDGKAEKKVKVDRKTTWLKRKAGRNLSQPQGGKCNECSWWAEKIEPSIVMWGAPEKLTKLSGAMSMKTRKWVHSYIRSIWVAFEPEAQTTWKAINVGNSQAVSVCLTTGEGWKLYE